MYIIVILFIGHIIYIYKHNIFLVMDPYQTPPAAQLAVPRREALGGTWSAEFSTSKSFGSEELPLDLRNDVAMEQHMEHGRTWSIYNM